MVAAVRYDLFMKLWIAATVAVFTLALSPLHAQINGVPASVSSIGFGGNFSRPPGVPASVTSIGPAGLVPNGNFVIPNNFANHPFVHFNQNPVFPHGHRGDRGRNFGNNVAILPVPYAVPYAVPVAVPYGGDESSDDSAEQYNGGPTIFDRRGDGQAYAEHAAGRGTENETSPPPVTQGSAEPAPVQAAVDQPPTMLVFKDGHKLEVQNYAIIGDTLYDMTPGHRRRVSLSELDLAATAQQNEDRGIDFQVPTT